MNRSSNGGDDDIEQQQQQQSHLRRTEGGMDDNSSTNDYDDENDNNNENETTKLITRNTKKEGSIQSGLPESIPSLPDMKIRCHKLEEQQEQQQQPQKDNNKKKNRTTTTSSSSSSSCLTHCTTKEALAGAKAGKGHYWIDIDAYCNYNNSSGTSGSNNNRRRRYNYGSMSSSSADDSFSNNTQSSNELRSWLNQLESLPSFVIDVLSNHPDTWASQVLPLQNNNAILAVIRILPPSFSLEIGGYGGSLSTSTTKNDNVNDGSDHHHQQQQHEMAHLAALCLRNMLITFTSSSYPTLRPSPGSSSSAASSLYSDVLQRMKQTERLPALTSHGAFLTWLKYHIDITSNKTRQLRQHINSMDELMDKQIENVSLDEIIQVKDSLLQVLSVAEEQGECIESLIAVTKLSNAADHNTDSTNSSTSSSIFSSKHKAKNSNAGNGNGNGFQLLQGSLSVLLATVGSTERMTIRLEKHITDLRQRYENYEQHKINQRLALLTVLSAIFLPLTLFTGIWGMNFAYMPELNKPYAYPIALSFMICIACIMICYFRYAGWFN